MELSKILQGLLEARTKSEVEHYGKLLKDNSDKMRRELNNWIDYLHAENQRLRQALETIRRLYSECDDMADYTIRTHAIACDTLDKEDTPCSSKLATSIATE